MLEHEKPIDDRARHDSAAFGTSRTAMMVAFGITWLAVTGYFIGLGSPMVDHEQAIVHDSAKVEVALPADRPLGVIAATTYDEMHSNRLAVNHDWATRLATIKQEPYDLHAAISLNQSQKLVAMKSLAELRAFNGAPPTVPHPINQMTSRGCVACHGEGFKTTSLRAAKMPHPFYSSCTQCHVEKTSQHADAIVFRENTFVGLVTPTSGSRAFDTAPPVIPHSTWLRDNCLSCHGRTARSGLRTTHPWRNNCLQCHSISSQLNQTEMAATPRFLPPPHMKESDEQ